MVSPSLRRPAVIHLQSDFGASQRRACALVGQPRSTQRYSARVDDDEWQLVGRMHELVRENPRFGCRRVCALLRGEGWRVNMKRVHRLWKAEGFKVPRRQVRKRRLGGPGNGCMRSAPRDRARFGRGISCTTARRTAVRSSG